ADVRVDVLVVVEAAGGRSHRGGGTLGHRRRRRHGGCGRGDRHPGDGRARQRGGGGGQLGQQRLLGGVGRSSRSLSGNRGRRDGGLGGGRRLGGGRARAVLDGHVQPGLLAGGRRRGRSRSRRRRLGGHGRQRRRRCHRLRRAVDEDLVDLRQCRRRGVGTRGVETEALMRGGRRRGIGHGDVLAGRRVVGEALRFGQRGRDFR